MPRWIEATEDSCRFHRTLMILPELKIRVSPREPHQHEWESVLFNCILKSIGKTRPRFSNIGLMLYTYCKTIALVF